MMETDLLSEYQEKEEHPLLLILRFSLQSSLCLYFSFLLRGFPINIAV